MLSKVKRFDAPNTEYWKLNTLDARGNVLDELLGNGVQVISGFDPLTGLLESRTAGPSAGTSIQNLDYEWELNGNLWKRKDVRQSNLEEIFSYDALDRVTGSTLNGSPNLTVAFDLIGNITSKDGSGYTYHASKKHAVTAAAGNTYTYDANGNVATKNGSTISWTSYNYPSSIAGSGVSSQFWYGPDRQRSKQVGNYSGGTETTHYVGGILEKLVTSTRTHFKHYIAGPNGLVATHTRRTDATEDTFYFTKDHLGSVDSVTNQAGSVQVRLSFEAFGKRRNESGWSGSVPSADLTAIANTSRRGYTEHEMLDNLGLIHMNGRVQDPVIGRFLSADPNVPNPTSGQSFNRYSYVQNNPLSFTDPSGFEEEEEFEYQDNYGYGGDNSHFGDRTTLGSGSRCYGECGGRDYMNSWQTWECKENCGLLEGETLSDAEAQRLFDTPGDAGARSAEGFDRNGNSIAGSIIGTVNVDTGELAGVAVTARGFGSDGITGPIFAPEGTVSMGLPRWLYEQCSVMMCHGNEVYAATQGFMPDWEQERLAKQTLIAVATAPIGSWLNAAKGLRAITFLYQKIGPLGEHLKFGITSNPATRYSATELGGGRLRILASGSREEMLTLERSLHETLPIGTEEGQMFYIWKQVERGLIAPPYPQ